MLGALRNYLYRSEYRSENGIGIAVDNVGLDAEPAALLAAGTQDALSSGLACNLDAMSYVCNAQNAGKDVCSPMGCDSSSNGLLYGASELDIELRADRQCFLRSAGEDYGYGGLLDAVRREEFSRLAGQAYLDYAGAALYSERQIRECSEELLTTLMCNPHSAPTSTSADAMAALRRDTLELLNADGRLYDVIITSGATAALQMVAECFPWSPGASLLAHPTAVHNSVLGMRGPALAAGAAVQLVRLAAGAAAWSPPPSSPRDAAGSAAADGARHPGQRTARGTAEAEVDCKAAGRRHVVPIGAPMTSAVGAPTAAVEVDSPSSEEPPAPWHLLALPVECNFTGDREPLADAVRFVQQYGISGGTATPPASAAGAGVEAGGDANGGHDVTAANGSGGRWLVLLDAAKACATAPPDLAAVPADFVVLSYYKIFGHPTGLGALVARKDALALLAAGKSYFGGGTVEVAVADRPYHVRRSGPPGLEDGTPPFTAIAAARHGFAFLRRLGGLPAVHRHARSLARWLAARLRELRHANGAPACVLYGAWCGAAAAAGARDHGPVVSFNLLRPDGAWVGYAEVGRLAAMHGLHLRTGCFCNPGACAEWLGLSSDDVIRHHRAGHVCWDEHDLVGGRPTGAVRVSLGAASTFEDVHDLLRLLRHYFVDNGSSDGSGAADPRRSGRSGGVAAAGGVAAPLTQSASRAAAAAIAAVPGGRRIAEADGMCAAAAAAAGAGSGGGDGGSVAEAPSSRQGCGPSSRPQQVQPTIPPSASSEEQSTLSRGRAQAGPVTPSGTVSLPTGGSRDAAVVTAALSTAATSTASTGCEPAGGGGCSDPAPGRSSPSSPEGRLSRILLYPVKSCGPQTVAAWPIGPTGLLYDREWALVDDNGKVLTLKHCPRMALVRPRVDLARGTLTIAAPEGAGVLPLELAIPDLFRRRQAGAGAAGAVARAAAAAGQPSSWTAAQGAATAAEGACKAVVQHRDAVRLDAGLTMERVQVCGDTVCSDLVDVCHDSAGDVRVRQWFVRVLGAPCRIVQQRPGARKVRRPVGQQGPAVAAAATAAAATPAATSGTRGAAEIRADQQRRPRLECFTSGGYEGGISGVDVGDGGGGGAADVASEPLVGFANDGQYLLVSEESMRDLRARLRKAGGADAAAWGGGGDGGDDGDVGDLLSRLRPNLVVAGFAPYDEDGWAAVRVGPLAADVLGTCPRCELLQVDPRVGVRRGAEVLIALAQYRRRGGRVQFGVLLASAAAAKTTPGPALAAAGGAEAAEDAGGVGVVAWGEARARRGTSKGLEGGNGEAAASVQWLRREFGLLSVVAIGDRVVPAVPAGGSGGGAGGGGGGLGGAGR